MLDVSDISAVSRLMHCVKGPLTKCTWCSISSSKLVVLVMSNLYLVIATSSWALLIFHAASRQKKLAKVKVKDSFERNGKLSNTNIKVSTYCYEFEWIEKKLADRQQ
jgi:hypothetical protein